VPLAYVPVILLGGNRKTLTNALSAGVRLVVFIGLMVWAPFGVRSREEPVTLSPRLQAGQTFTYLIRFRTEKHVKTESRVVTPMGPDEAEVDAHTLLSVEVLDVQPENGKAIVHVRTQFIPARDGLSLQERVGQQVQPDAGINPRKPVEFTLLADGRVDRLKGFDALLPEQQQTWQEWVRHFAIANAFPRGVKRGQKWKSEDAEKSPSPIAGLNWVKTATYVRDEPCRLAQATPTGDVAPSDRQSETCAVVLTTAILKQKSSPRDATPGDYKLHELRTLGTAKGVNETITYISLSTGLVVRATEEAKQFMDVIVAKADGSNRVHYNVEAKSHVEVLLVEGTAPNSN